MERKYYLRGLGLGIVMTAIIMGIALSGGHKMTDEEIIERAKELGMVEDTYLTDSVAGEEETSAKQNTKEENPAGEKNLSVAEPEPESPQTKGENLLESAEAEEDEPLPVAEPVKEETTENEPAEKEEKPLSEAGTKTAREDTNEMTRQEDSPAPSAKTARVTIVSGDGSYTVALKLQEAGVVVSAETFDDFLCENGYDKKLRTGTFRIPTDASDEQIARIVTGQE